MYGDSLPVTCCPKFWTQDEALAYSFTGCTIEDATNVGCKEKIVKYIKENLIVWIAVGFTLTISLQV